MSLISFQLGKTVLIMHWSLRANLSSVTLNHQALSLPADK